MSESVTPGIANVIGTGLIGGSVAMALKERGWQVWGDDADSRRLDDAVEARIIDQRGLAPEATITFVATPVADVAEQVERALVRTAGLVTDVAGVKESIASVVSDSRYVPGHPMAGSEQEGLKGARSDLFSGAVWVLTPGPRTAEHAYTAVGSIVRSLGADVVTLQPAEHDLVVATVSHVPHLTASALMCVADEASERHRAMLRLAAGGFRDMTRIASGHPGIWPDICVQNQDAILAALDALITRLQNTRDAVAESDREAIYDQLVKARTARTNLPSGMPKGLALAEVRVPIPDRPGELARITTVAPQVNIYDFEIAHTQEGMQGVGVIVVALDDAEAFCEHLRSAAYHPTYRAL